MEVNNRFRSVFAEEDTNDYRDALIENLAQQITEGVVKEKDRQKNMKHINDLVAQYRQQNKKLNDDLLRTVHGYSQAMTKEGRNKFLAIADTLQMLTIQMNNSKNPKAMLSACQLYNAGVFDTALEEVKKMKEKSGLSVMQEGIVDLQGNKL
jgi:hypothetical protein